MINDAASLQHATKIVQQHQFSGLGLQYADYVQDITLPQALLTQLWYHEREPQQVQRIITIAANKGFSFINLDSLL